MTDKERQRIDQLIERWKTWHQLYDSIYIRNFFSIWPDDIPAVMDILMAHKNPDSHLGEGI